MIFINTICSAYPLLKWHFEILFVVYNIHPHDIIKYPFVVYILNCTCIHMISYTTWENWWAVSLNGFWSCAIFYYPTDQWWRIRHCKVHVITNGKQPMKKIHDCKQIHFRTHCFVHASLRRVLLNYRFRAVTKGLLMMIFRRKLFWSILQYCVKL